MGLVKKYLKQKREREFSEAVAERYGLTPERAKQVVRVCDAAYNQLIAEETAAKTNTTMSGYVSIAKADEKETIAKQLRDLASQRALLLEDVEHVYEKCDYDMDMLKTVLHIMSLTFHTDERVLSDLDNQLRIHEKDLQKHYYFIKFKEKWKNRQI